MVAHRDRALDRLGATLGTAALVMWASAVMLDGAADPPSGRAGGAAEPAARTAGASAPETLFAGYVGVPYTHASDVHFVAPGRTDLTVHAVNWDGRPFKSPIYYGLRAVRWGNGAAGAMLDFTHSKAIAQPAQEVRLSGTRNGRAAPPSAHIGDTFRHLEFSHGHNMLTANGLMRLGPALGLFSPYVGLGAGANLPHTEIQFVDDAARTYEYQYAGPVGQALAGLELRLPRVSLFVEYKLTLSRYEAPLSGRDNKTSFGYTDFLVQLAAWWRGEAPRYGVARTTLLSHQAIGGVAWRLAATPAP
jgi:opacity protein-like surface antigen